MANPCDKIIKPRLNPKGVKFPAQFEGKSVSDDFLPGADIDIVSGATISTMAGTEAIRQAAHIAVTQYFKLEPKWQT